MLWITAGQDHVCSGLGKAEQRRFQQLCLRIFVDLLLDGKENRPLGKDNWA
jgi:hypothetical protein